VVTKSDTLRVATLNPSVDRAGCLAAGVRPSSVRSNVLSTLVK
jgi:hypothetical protein